MLMLPAASADRCSARRLETENKTRHKVWVPANGMGVLVNAS